MFQLLSTSLPLCYRFDNIFVCCFILKHKDLCSVWFFLSFSIFHQIIKEDIFRCLMFDDGKNPWRLINQKKMINNSIEILEMNVQFLVNCLEMCLLSCHFLSSVAPHIFDAKQCQCLLPWFQFHFPLFDCKFSRFVFVRFSKNNYNKQIKNFP